MLQFGALFCGFVSRFGIRFVRQREETESTSKEYIVVREVSMRGVNLSGAYPKPMIAVVQCKYCGASMNSKAEVCPQCGKRRTGGEGEPVQRKSTFLMIAAGCVIVLLVIGLLFWAMQA